MEHDGEKKAQKRTVSIFAVFIVLCIAVVSIAFFWDEIRELMMGFVGGSSVTVTMAEDLLA